MRTKKAQVFSLDVVISLIIFMFLVTICFYLWNRTYDKSSYFSEQNLMKERLFQITDLMIRTPGYPENWTEENVRLIGLSSKDHILQLSKLNQLLSMNITQIKDKLRIRDYNFLLNITTTNNSFVLGSLWNINSSMVLAQSRIILLNDSNKLERGVLKLYLWK